MSTQEKYQIFHEPSLEAMSYTMSQEGSGGRGNKRQRTKGGQFWRNNQGAQQNSWAVKLNQSGYSDNKNKLKKTEQSSAKQINGNSEKQNGNNSWIAQSSEKPQGRGKGRGRYEQNTNRQKNPQEKNQNIYFCQNRVDMSWMSDSKGNISYSRGQGYVSENNKKENSAWSSFRQQTGYNGRGNKNRGGQVNQETQNYENKEGSIEQKSYRSDLTNNQYHGNFKNREGVNNYGGYNGTFKKKDYYENGRGTQRRNYNQNSEYTNTLNGRNNKYSQNRRNNGEIQNGNRQDKGKKGFIDRKSYGNNNYQNGKQNTKPEEQNGLLEQSTLSIKTEINPPETPILKIEPKGQKCWPEASIFIKGMKVCFTYRKIAQHCADILIIPYSDLKFRVYPGKIINLFNVDYRKKLEEKGKQIQAVGSVCCQRCVGFDNFKAIGFLRIGNPSQMKVCIGNLFLNLSRVKIQLKTILLPYSEDLGEPEPLFDEIFKILGSLNQKKFDKIVITTESESDFIKGITVFGKKLVSMTENNEIYIDN